MNFLTGCSTSDTFYYSSCLSYSRSKSTDVCLSLTANAWSEANRHFSLPAVCRVPKFGDDVTACRCQPMIIQRVTVAFIQMMRTKSANLSTRPHQRHHHLLVAPLGLTSISFRQVFLPGIKTIAGYVYVAGHLILLRRLNTCTFSVQNSQHDISHTSNSVSRWPLNVNKSTCRRPPATSFCVASKAAWRLGVKFRFTSIKNCVRTADNAHDIR